LINGVVGSSDGADHSFPFCHRGEAMQMRSKGGAEGMGWNEVVADG